MGRNIYPNHVGISVQNIDEAIAWYNDILGFELIEKVNVEHLGCTIAIIRNGNFDIELFGHKSPVALPADRKHPDSDPMYIGTKHICLHVDGLDDFISEITAKGVKIIVGPGQFGTNKFYYISDPDGVLIELNEPIE